LRGCILKRLLSGLVFFLFTFHYSPFTAAYAASETPNRIISLAPNMTEILFALGLGDNIVGVTSFCDYPEEAKKKPKIGGMSNPSIEAVVSLKPDIVVMTTDGNPKEFEERLRSMKIKTYVFTSRRLSELPQGVRALGVALGVKDRADAFARDFETNLSKFKAQDSKSRTKKKKVLFIVWPEPLIVAGPGTVIDDALEAVGAENIASGAMASYPKYSTEEILRRQPDMIIIGNMLGDDRKISKGLLQKLKILPAVKNKKVFYVSDDLYRLGPRIMRGLGEISKLVDN
jgi:iron complex transport system substrate-binding protein